MKTQKERLEYCQEWKNKLDQQFLALKEQRKDSLNHLAADESIVAVLDGRSRITTTDMQDAIDAAKPDILETIAGVDDPMKLDPDSGEWVEKVKKLEILGNVMIRRKNSWYRICNDFLDDSMVMKFGCIKYRWVKEKPPVIKEYEGLDDLEIQGLLMGKADVSLLSDEVGGDGKRVTKINYVTKDEYVKYDGVPAERIKFPLDTKDFASTPIVIEEVVLYEHDYIKQYGQTFFNKVKEMKKATEKPADDSAFNARLKHLGGVDHLFDSKADKYRAYETYFWVEGKAWVMTWVGDEIALDEENKYGKPPYRGGSPFLVAHCLIGKGYIDLIGKLQEEHTALKRLGQDVITQNCFRRLYADIDSLGMNIDDFENNSATNALVRCQANPNEHIMMEPKIPLGQEFLSWIEMFNIEKDSHIPTPRSYAGLEGAKEERTYRGKQLKVNQASKKILMMMRGYMEEVFGPLFQDTLDCIAKFMKQPTVKRYLNVDYDISPEDVICKYALVVNVGLGSHDKQDLIVKLQQLIGLAMQQMHTGIITAQNLYYMNQELVKAMGFLNTTDFVTDPQLQQAVMELIQEMTKLLQVMGQNPQMAQLVQMIGSQFQQTSQKVATLLGVQQEQPKGGGNNSQGTQPGQNPAAIPTQPGNEFNPQTLIDGKGFYS